MTSKASPKTILVIAGMPGAGKSLASRVAKQHKIPVFISGDVIRREARTRNLNPTKENLGRLMLNLRREEGMGAVAARLVPLIRARTEDYLVYEGARNIEEVDVLRKSYRVLVIGVHASAKTRFQRLLKRKRRDRPRNWKDFSERDQRELKVGVGKVIALADRMVENEETREALKRRMKRLLNSLLKQKASESLQKPKSGRQKTRRK